MPQVTTGDPLPIQPMAQMTNNGFNALAVMIQQVIHVRVVGMPFGRCPHNPQKVPSAECRLMKSNFVWNRRYTL